MTILDIAQSMKGRLRDGLSQTQSGTQPGESEVAFGTAAADSSGGFVSIIMDGAPVGEPGYDPADYTFEVACDSPITAGDRVSYISDAGRGKAVSVATLTQIAQDADAIATATDQHFWADSGGVHVSTDEDDPAGAQNIIMNSAGVLLREGSDYLAAFTPSAVAFYDGNGNDAANIVASFGSAGATIGSASSAGIAMNDTGMSMSDGNGMIIAEMANSGVPVTETMSKSATLQEGESAVISLDGIAAGSTFTAGIGNQMAGAQTFTQGISATKTATYSGRSASFAYDGSSTLTATMSSGNGGVRVEYESSAVDAPYFTFGTRYGTPAAFSAAIGRGLEVSQATGVAVGQFNDDDGGIFQVGIGADSSSPKNALSVAQNGAVSLSTPLGISSGGTGSSTVSGTLSNLGITYEDYDFSVTYAAGTVGTRGAQYTANCAKTGKTAVAATISYINSSTNTHPLAFFNQTATTLYLNAYRASTSAVNNMAVTVRVFYIGS